MPDEPTLSNIDPIEIQEEMERSFLDYAMSVITSRALPDARDGLKPVQRRILYGMYDQGMRPDRLHRKSANAVGHVMAVYHPHGDQAIYDALARMAQDFSLRYPLIDGHGNFGSPDPNDRPAAMRYTESKLAPLAMQLLGEIDEDTVDFTPTYDGRTSEPVVLPARFPNLLVNGGGGIAVGMATNIPPHNLGEVIDACIALIDRPDMTIAELTEIVPGPDFPTGGAILGHAGIRAAYALGRGSIVMRARIEMEQLRKDRDALIVTEIPYQINKAHMVECIAELIREKKIEGVSDLRDESNREGIRIVFELRRDAVPDVVLNQLWRHTSLQSSFAANIIALNGGRPEVLTLKDILRAFIDFREEVVTRRTKFRLNKARDSAHVQVGLAIAVANIDEVIRLIRTSPDAGAAREALMGRSWPARDMSPLIALIADPRHVLDANGEIRLSETQARAILDLRLQRLTALGRDEIAEALNKLAAEIADYLDILRSRTRLFGIVKGEMLAVKDAHATPRRTLILDVEDEVEDEDLVSRLFVASTHTPVLFFSSKGQVYKEKVWRLPLSAPQARGKFLNNLLPLGEGERITTIMPLPEDEAQWETLDVMFATTRGTVRRNKLSDFADVRRSGIIAMRLDDGEAIVDVQICTENDDVLLTTAGGMCIRFPVTDVRVFQGRTSMGVRGISLDSGDKVISLSILRHVEATPDERAAYLKRALAVRRGLTSEAAEAELQSEIQDQSDLEEAAGAIELGEQRYVEMSEAEQFVFTVSERGFGKRTSSYEYRITGRGGKGIVAMDNAGNSRDRLRTIRPRIGLLVASLPVEHNDQLMLVTDGGQLIRVPVDDIRIAGRKTQGVIVFNTTDGERVVSAERIGEEETVEEG